MLRPTGLLPKIAGIDLNKLSADRLGALFQILSAWLGTVGSPRSKTRQRDASITRSATASTQLWAWSIGDADSFPDSEDRCIKRVSQRPSRVKVSAHAPYALGVKPQPTRRHLCRLLLADWRGAGRLF